MPMAVAAMLAPDFFQCGSFPWDIVPQLGPCPQCRDPD